MSNPRMTFDRKDYGRILVQKEEDIDKVKEIIKEMDEFEYGYMPQDLIGVFERGNIETVYTGKFDALDLMELQIRCWEQNIPIMILDGIITTDYGNYKEFKELKW